jgi:hypothetical protein
MNIFSNRRFSEFVLAPLLECSVLLVAGMAGLVLGRPSLFASLGPTAYEQVFQANTPSSRFYNVFFGHIVGVGSGFAALYLAGAIGSPKVLSSEPLSWIRIGASVLAVLLTTVVGKLLGCTQPAALATTLLIALGLFQSWHDAQTIIIGVAVVAIAGEPVRRWRLRQIEREERWKEDQARQRAA